MKKWTSWIAILLVISLLAGCSNAGDYVKDHYPLISADGNGNNLSKVYAVEGKDVPTVANELAEQEKPKEKSKESADQMFLLYDNKVINIQKDPKDAANTLVQVDTVQYARDHYDSSFLQGYLTATLLQSVFGGGWYNSRQPADYRGYTRTPAYSSSSGSYKTPAAIPDKDKKPTTSDRTGSFNSGTKGSAGSGAVKSGSSSSSRKNDGSTPNRVSSGSSKPKTSTRSGSFSRRK